mmetsp:Transcript_37387/g.69648  ORF Transcript_37387/g.69648 Transcript_37387/m.69648 type:complete len:371 (+) Transcript_37387:139-1251(+)
MDLYGDLPPAQGEVSTFRGGETEYPEQKSSVITKIEPSGDAATEKKARKISVSGVAAQNFAAFKPRQTKKSLASQRSIGVMDESPLVDAPRMILSQSFSKCENSAVGGTERNKIHSLPLSASATPQLDHVTVSTPSRPGITSYETEGLPYDPHRPNDYLEWCAERLDNKRAKRLEEENRLVLEAMEDSRKKLEDERSSAMKSGDIKRLEASAVISAGRGRGVMNLPAWMTSQLNSSAVNEQQQKEHDQPQHCPAPRKRSLFTNPSTILLLSNINKKVDADIEKEMEQECQKYGSIRMCLVREVSLQTDRIADNDEVCVYVCFYKQESAVRAFRDLDGRYFDGRQIVATFYDEDIFRKNILAGAEHDRLSE